MPKVNWYPEMCSCALVLEYDADGSNERLVEVLNRCKDHSPITGQALFNTVAQEHRRKSRVLALAQALDSKVENVEWRFDNDRRLIIRTVLSTARKAQLTAQLVAENIDVTLE